MKLPNLENALIEENKITGYLLSDENSGGKAGFFTTFAFEIATWQRLRDALFQHATDHPIKSSIETKHGIKYIIEGTMRTPDSRLPHVRSIWIIDAGKDVPRFITAYPLKGGYR